MAKLRITTVATRDGIYLLRSAQYQFLQFWFNLNLCLSIVDLHRANFGDYGGQHGQESEEDEEGEEDNQKEKEVTVRLRSTPTC